MPTLTNTIDIKASPDEVWAVLADLPATRHWLPGVVAAHMAGDVRICRMADGREVHETISELSPDRHRYRFDHLRTPLPVRDSSGSFAVTAGPDPRTATVTLTSSFEPIDPAGVDQLTAMIQAAFQQSLESLRRYVEDKLAWDAN